MKNEILEQFIEKSNLTNFKKEYINQVMINLIDENGESLTLFNIFDDVIVTSGCLELGRYKMINLVDGVKFCLVQ